MKFTPFGWFITGVSVVGWVCSFKLMLFGYDPLCAFGSAFFLGIFTRSMVVYFTGDDLYD